MDPLSNNDDGDDFNFARAKRRLTRRSNRADCALAEQQICERAAQKFAHFQRQRRQAERRRVSFLMRGGSSSARSNECFPPFKCGFRLRTLQWPSARRAQSRPPFVLERKERTHARQQLMKSNALSSQLPAPCKQAGKRTWRAARVNTRFSRNHAPRKLVMATLACAPA